MIAYSKIKAGLRRQLPNTLRLAIPVAVGQLGHMLMTLIDTYMVGKLGPEAIGGVGVGAAIFFVFMAFGMGVLTGLDFLVAHAFGRDRVKECHSWLIEGTTLSLFLSIPSVFLLEIIASNMWIFRLDPVVAQLAADFLKPVSWSLIPLLIFIAFRQYLQAMNSVRFSTLVMGIANLSNVLFNWLFIFGHWGFPALGVKGSGVATTLTRSLMALLLIGFAFYRDRHSADPLWKTRLVPTLNGLRGLAKIGLPAGTQLVVEVTVFSLSSILAGKLGALDLAAHIIVINVASFVFMIPMGIAAAASVQVGQAVGAGNESDTRLAGWSALFLSTCLMTSIGFTLYFFGPQIVRLFTQDPEVIQLGSLILLFAAFFQIADGTQMVGTGALRGLGDTRAAAYINFFGHWMVGLPFGCFLCFYLHKGLPGLWAGLTLGLFTVATFIINRWIKKSRHPLQALTPGIATN